MWAPKRVALIRGNTVNRTQHQMGTFQCSNLPEVCVQVTVAYFSRFCTTACQVFTIQKSFLIEIPLNMNTATLNTLCSQTITF